MSGIVKHEKNESHTRMCRKSERIPPEMNHFGNRIWHELYREFLHGLLIIESKIGLCDVRTRSFQLARNLCFCLDIRLKGN